MAKTIQLTAGILGGLWGIGVSVLWWVLYFVSDQIAGGVQILIISGVMGGFSSLTLLGTRRAILAPTRTMLVPLWTGTLLLLISTTLTFLSVGVLYTPGVLLLLIAAVFATIRTPRRPGELSRWIELLIGGGGACIGIGIAIQRLTTKSYSTNPESNFRLEANPELFLWEANLSAALFMLLLGTFSLIMAASFLLHAWRNPRKILPFIWAGTAGLLLIVAGGISMGSLIYLPTILLVIIGSAIATFRDYQ